jgi:glutathione synthase/RimK-type ligase-like ATP-grasp enzyme
MKIAIHYSKHSFCERWISYCKENHINYKKVNCYSTDIVQQLTDCDALMWHHFQTNPRAVLFARQLLFALEQSGKTVFPDFNTGWHFDDKLGQKYLLEAIGAPLVPSYVFYDKKEALRWIKNTNFPKVLKLRGGAGSSNVRLIKSPGKANKVISKAFRRGFSNYNAWSNLKEIFRKFQLGNATGMSLIKGIAHIFYPPRFSKIMGREQGYVYFQDFIPGNDYDIRVVIIDDKAFAIKRLVRKNDFRASGSGHILYDQELFDEKTIRLAFELADKLKGQCIAFDFVYDANLPKLLEISYGFVPEGYDPCPGYWDKSMKWIAGKFDPYGWMVEIVMRDVVE